MDFILSENKNAADAARKFNLSREAVRLILNRNGIDYAGIKSARTAEVKQRLAKSKTRLCKQCGKSFIPPHLDGRIKYCSEECRQTHKREAQKERVKLYYMSEKGKESIRLRREINLQTEPNSKILGFE